ncbi:15229_t:CDS:2, partial [Dentiscutata erythropus]
MSSNQSFDETTDGKNTEDGEDNTTGTLPITSYFTSCKRPTEKSSNQNVMQKKKVSPKAVG